MSLKVVFPNSFTKRANRLARRHPALTAELRALQIRLLQGETPGNRLMGVGALVFKVRLANPSGQRGKSGGFRVAYHVGAEQITMLAVCLKPKCDNVKQWEIRNTLRELALI